MPSELSTQTLLFILVLLILISALFSGTETGMMALNRYRLKNAKNSSRTARRILKLLERPDRLLGVILIGNNFVNISASAIATIIGLRLMGDIGVLVATILLTFVILIFGEITPKTSAALKPEVFAYPAALPLLWLQWLLFPFVWLSNLLANSIIRLFGIRHKTQQDSLNLDELRIVVQEARGFIPSSHQKMLMRLIDLEKVTVNDIMIPRSDVIGIDLNDELDTILSQLKNLQHSRLPIFRDDIDKVEGSVSLRDLSQHAITNDLTTDVILQMAEQPYFVPEGTSLHTQLINFQKKKRHFAMVVDEYGDVQGIVTLNDILEEIVGQFSVDAVPLLRMVHPQADGSYIVNGSANIRHLNRTMGWELPADGAVTLSGRIIEALETIPTPATGMKLASYQIEILQVQDNMIKSVKIYPQKN